MGRPMGLDFGLESGGSCFKYKNRWLMKVEGVSASGVGTLPPLKSARPNVSFKEMEVQHLNETVYYPQKPEWKPVSLVLYDLKSSTNPVLTWLANVYDPQSGAWVAPGDGDFMKNVSLEMYDGCGELMETWVYENAWPQAVEFGDMDMSLGGFMTIDVTLRYARAFVEIA